ncbi:MAG: tRNA pseudouridine(55) synthase TruB, partial [Deltaproteobacteria bacterium]|nr:tRNA pseudouridine(55) synthase TruB [Deltaproteobacteria bacterium]
WADETEATERLEQALAVERERREQLPPAHSAIKLQGKAAYARARSGEEVVLALRPIQVRTLELVARDPAAGQLEVELTVSKGYYVRSLARDLGATCGLPAHLCALQRTRSGTFPLSQAVGLDDPALASHLIPLAAAATTALPTATLTEAGTVRAGYGGPMAQSDFSQPPPESGPSAWCDPAGRLRAVGTVADGRPKVLRGFAQPAEEAQVDPG